MRHAERQCCKLTKTAANAHRPPAADQYIPADTVNTFKNILYILSTGYIFVFFSEHLFWAHVRADDSLKSWVSTWIAYSLMAFIFLRLVSYFRVKTIWALFLAGAVFGWLAEGVIVQTAYEMLPWSISFTGLAWHALITVWIGWYAVQKALLSSTVWSSIKLSSLIGVIYGIWAINWWVEPDGRVSSIAEFAIFTFTTATLVIFAYWLANLSSPTPMQWNRWVTLVIVMLFGVYFFLVTVPASPIAIAVLPILLGVAYWGLRQNRLNEDEGSLLETLTGRASLKNFLGLFGLPITSTLTYALAMSINLKAHTNWVFYLITTPLGLIVFAVSLYKLKRQAQSSMTEAR